MQENTIRSTPWYRTNRWQAGFCVVVGLVVACVVLAGRLKDLQEQVRRQEAEKARQLAEAKAEPKPITLMGHTSSIESVAFSPDGQRLACASTAGKITVYDTAKFNSEWPPGSTLWGNLESLKLKNLSGKLTCVAFSPNGQRLAAARSDGTIQVCDAATGEELLMLKGYGDHFRMMLAFSPDGERLASAGADNTVLVWDAATGEELQSLKGHTRSVSSVAFSPDGQRLASGSHDQTVKVWDTATGRELLTIKGCTNTVVSLAFSPDGKRLASVDMGEAKLWDAATGQQALKLKLDSVAIFCVAFSPDGRWLATGSNQPLVLVWDAATGQKMHAFKGHTHVTWSVAFSPDGNWLASGGGDDTAKVWDVTPRAK